MSIYDRLRKKNAAPAAPVAKAAPTAAPTATPSAAPAGDSWDEPAVKTVAPGTVIFEALPQTADEMKALPEFALDAPYKTAALVVCALCVYGKNREEGKNMLNLLRGPRPLSPMDISFLNDRFMDGKGYIPFSYFKGATPENNYTPAAPFTLEFISDDYSAVNAGYYTLRVSSGGADSPRSITLRQKGDQWFLWEQQLLVGIRVPKTQNAWA